MTSRSKRLQKAMAKLGHPALIVLLALAMLGCEQRTDKEDTGGVLLELEIAGDFPFRVSVNSSDRLILDGLVVTSVIARPGGTSSDLMSVDLNTFEVTFSRADSGTRVPQPLTRSILGRVPAGGSANFSLTIMSSEQLRTVPLSDLLFENGGFDKETGSTNIKMNVTMRFFGRTATGKAVSTLPRTLTLEFVP